jgi:hypothetical protein
LIKSDSIGGCNEFIWQQNNWFFLTDYMVNCGVQEIYQRRKILRAERASWGRYDRKMIVPSLPRLVGDTAQLPEKVAMCQMARNLAQST